VSREGSTWREVPWLAVYRANYEAPPEEVLIDVGTDVLVTLHPGNCGFEFAYARRSDDQPLRSLSIEQRTMVLPSGSYVLIMTAGDMTDPYRFREQAIRRTSEVACLLEMRHPHILIEQVFEGIPKVEGQSVWLSEAGMVLGHRDGPTSAGVADGLAEDAGRLGQMPPSDRERFQLASRWYLRGLEAESPLDGFLLHWTVLEVFARTPRKVVGSAARRLAEALGLPFTHRDVQRGLSLGRMHGLRSSIVHGGKAFLSIEEAEAFLKVRDLLSVVARACLRVLAGQEVGDEVRGQVAGSQGSREPSP